MAASIQQDQDFDASMVAAALASSTDKETDNSDPKKPYSQEEIGVIPPSFTSRPPSDHVYAMGTWKFQLESSTNLVLPIETEPSKVVIILSPQDADCSKECKYVIDDNNLLEETLSTIPGENLNSKAFAVPYETGPEDCIPDEMGEVIAFVELSGEDFISSIKINSKRRDELDGSWVAETLKVELKLKEPIDPGCPDTEGKVLATYIGVPANTEENPECAVYVGWTRVPGFWWLNHLFVVYKDEMTRRIGLRAGPEKSITNLDFGKIVASIEPFDTGFGDHKEMIGIEEVARSTSLCGIKKQILTASQELDKKVDYNLLERNSNTYASHLLGHILNASVKAPSATNPPGFANKAHD